MALADHPLNLPGLGGGRKTASQRRGRARSDVASPQQEELGGQALDKPTKNMGYSMRSVREGSK